MKKKLFRLVLMFFVFAAVYISPVEAAGTVEAPVIAYQSTWGGKYAIITCATDGASVYYTTDGETIPDEASAKYTNKFLLTETAKIKAIAVKSGMADSPVKVSTITVPGATTPAASVETGVGYKIISLTAGEGETIFYTLDGTEPNQNSNQYTEPVRITATTAIRAVSMRLGYSKSSEFNQSIIVSGSKISVSSVAAIGGQRVTITKTVDGDIYYTTDGSTPDMQSSIYTGAFIVSSSKTIKACVISNNTVVSNVTETVISVSKLSDVVIATDDINSERYVVMKSKENARIYYTNDGTNPDISSNEYSDKFKVTRNTEFKAIAVLEGYATSGVSSAEIIPFSEADSVSVPEFSSEAVVGGKIISLSTQTEDASIFYTLGTEEPNESSNLYSEPVFISETTYFRAVAAKVNMTKSAVVTARITINKLARPSASAEASGSYKLLSLAAEEGARIYYTMDLSEPTVNSELYTGPITITEKEIIRMIAVKEGCKTSDVLTVSVTVPFTVKAPVMSAEPVYGGKLLSLKSASINSQIYYTIDGTSPTTQSSKYTQPVLLTSGCTVRAFAVKDGGTDSSIKIGLITVDKVDEIAASVELTEDGKMITLSSSTEGAELFYTTDGTIPNENSIKYTAPLLFTKTSSIKVIAMKKGYISSKVANCNVTVTNPNSFVLYVDNSSLEKNKLYITAKNNTDKIKTAKILVTVYAGDKLVYIDIKDVNLAAGYNDYIFSDINIGARSYASCTVKAFLLDSFDSLKPISRAYVN